MKFIAIGDIHGCKQQLLEIIEETKKYPEYKLVFLGDYIDRGPDSNGVLDILRNLDAICLLGNHEDMLIHYIEKGNESYKKEQLRAHKISIENYEWIKSLPYIYENDYYIFSHAGLNPLKPLKDQVRKDFLWTFYDKSLTHVTEKIVVQGHLHIPELYIYENHIIVDTDCGLGGYLTGVILPDKKMIRSKTKSSLPNSFSRYL